MSLPAPNYTQVPNDLLDRAVEFTPAQFKLLMVLCRETFGWHVEWSRPRETSLTALQAKTGMSRLGVRQCLSALAPLIDWQDAPSGRTCRLRVCNSVAQANDQGVQLSCTEVGNSVAQVVAESIYLEKKAKETGTDPAPPLAAAALPGLDTPPASNGKPGRTRKTAGTAPADPALKLAVLAWLGLGDGTGASRGAHVNASRLAGVYRTACETDTTVQADAAAWYADDWRGKLGQAPTPTQAQDWRARRRNGNGHANGKTALRPGAHDPAEVHIYITAAEREQAKRDIATALGRDAL